MRDKKTTTHAQTVTANARAAFYARGKLIDDMKATAARYDARDDTVMREQTLRTIRELS